MAAGGAGCRVKDDRGAVLIDVNNNFTTLIHGHAHPQLVAAACEAIANGASFGLPTATEVEHARVLVERTGLDQVRYANSGSEAVSTALRIARAHSGRDRVIMLTGAYHGLGDQALVAAGERSTRGVAPTVRADVELVAVNDVEGLERVLGSDGRGIGTIMLDLLANRAGLVALNDAFLEAVERLRSAYGLVLIVDEVVSFRLARGGLTALRGVAPDLLVLGKTIGGGLPVGAVVGSEPIMAELNPFGAHPVEHGGTMTANPVTMAAGIASLALMDADAIERLNRLGDTVRAELAERITSLGWTVRGHGSLLRPFPPDAATTATDQLSLWWEAYERGVLLIPNALICMSTPMDDDVADEIVDRVADAVFAVARRSA
jgi:glutamate-1-semialdehyde 2,1-aminomutase